MSFRVFITRRIPDTGVRLLRDAGFVLNYRDRDDRASREELLAGAKEADGILCLLDDKIDRELIESAPNLKIISNYAVGYDNIDVPAATEKKIWVTNTPGVLTDATADLTWGLILSLGRRIVEGDRYVREGKFANWTATSFLGADFTEKTIGIVGMGRIGQAVARRALGFGMNVVYTTRRRDEGVSVSHLSIFTERKVESGDLTPSGEVRRVELPELLAASDVVSLHSPLTPETRHLIGEPQLKSMKPTALLINTARGPVVDEAPLVRALKEGWIAGAGLDVYEREPEIPPDLLSLPNTVLLPHIGSASRETRDKMSTLAAENLLAVKDGRTPPHPVNDV